MWALDAELRVGVSAHVARRSYELYDDHSFTHCLVTHHTFV